MDLNHTSMAASAETCSLVFGSELSTVEAFSLPAAVADTLRLPIGAQLHLLA